MLIGKVSAFILMSGQQMTTSYNKEESIFSYLNSERGRIAKV